jgi:tRNA-(ms[2]io[6]A)-hydroxylase
LALDISDDKLKSFYYKFMVSEAGHYRLFIQLAKTYNDPEKVDARWEEYLAYETDILEKLEVRGDRIH